MADCKDLQALGKITSEVDDSQGKIILSSQCIKAQIFLLERLRKELEQQKQICKFISSGNLKLQAEIKHAEQEFRSMLTAYETVKMSNVDLKKEFLLAKERFLETTERVNVGEVKYEQLWLQCKKRYENIPFAQKWFQYTNRTETLKDRIKFLHQETETLTKEIKTKRDALRDQDKKRIIEMAMFLVHERPRQLQEIQEKTIKIAQLSTEIDEYNKEQLARRDAVNPKEIVKADHNIMLDYGDWPSLCDSFNNVSLGMPMLQLARNDDLDKFNVNLEQIKKDVATPITTKSQELSSGNDKNKEKITTSFFNQSYLPHESDNSVTVEEETKAFSRKKLINILEDIAVDKTQAENMMATVDPHGMQEVTQIGANLAETHNETEATEMDQAHEETECDEIEEIDMSAGASNNVVIPPTQFMDFSQDRGIAIFQQKVEVAVHESSEPTTMSQPKDGSQQKRVLFDLPPIQEVTEEGSSAEVSKGNHDEDIISQMNVSGVSDDSFSKMREMILRKHKLDLSPDFVYAKKPANDSESPIITSKFFKSNEVDNKIVDDNKQFGRVEEGTQQTETENLESNTVLKDTKENEVEELTHPSAKIEEKADKTVSGFLFTHGPNGLPDSLDISISTTGFEDGDGEFPHCIDSSLLLSPKAELPMPSSGSNNEVYSQEVPNFLSGMRKTGLSFFGNSVGGQPDSSAAKDGNHFNFNFNKDDEKKSRGGFFSMFH